MEKREKEEKSAEHATGCRTEDAEKNWPIKK